jgi:histone H3/H4
MARSVRKHPLRDSIARIKTANIRELAYRAGIKLLSSGRNTSGLDVMYEEIRGKIKAFLERFLKKAIHYMQTTNNKKPFSSEDFYKIVNTGVNEDGDCRGEDGDCRGEDGSGYPVALQKTCFFRVVQEIVQDYGSDMKFSEDVKYLLQKHTEEYIVNIFKRAKRSAENARRKTVMVRDLNL